MGWRSRMSFVALATSLVGCADFVGVVDDTAGEDGSTSGTSESDPDTAAAAETSDSDSTTGASDSATSTTNPVDPSDPTDPNPTAPDPSDATSGDTGSSGGTTTTDEGSSSGDEGETGPGEDETGPDETTGAMECQQLDAEPNDDSMDAIDLGNVGACADGPMEAMGTALDTNDGDWMVYGGIWDCPTNTNNPNHVVTVTSGDVFVCLYPLCPSNGTQTNCLAGDTFVTGGGVTGCCSASEVSADVNCIDNGDESANGFVYVGALDGADACIDYTIEYDVVDG